MIDNRVHCVDAKRIEVKLIDPHQRVLNEKRSDVIALWAVEIQRHAPRRFVSVREVRAELAQIISFGAEVVVDDVEDDGQAALMRSVDEPLERMRPSIRILSCV